MKKDYYKTLGIDKTASEDEIKSAFRKLAKMYHPDNKQTGDEAKFKEVGEAYAVLSDKTKRSQYDQFGTADFNNAGGSGFSGFDAGDIDLDSIIKEFFGDSFSSFGSYGRRTSTGTRPRKGSDVKVDLTLTFEEAAFGCQKDITLNLNTKCSHCNGAGGFKETTCNTCKGRGRVLQEQRTIFGYMQTEAICPDCKGSGKTYKERCSVCDGDGLVKERKTITIDVPEGIDNGYELRLSGKGEAGKNGGENGDIYLEFNVKPHHLFERHGDDLYLEVPISLTDAVLGSKIEIPTLSGNVFLEIKPGTQNYTKLKLKGKGIKGPHSIIRGNMYAVINIIIPTKLSRKQKDLFLELEDTDLKDDNAFKDFNKYL